MKALIQNDIMRWRRFLILVALVAITLSLIPNSASALNRDPNKASMISIETDDHPWADQSSISTGKTYVQPTRLWDRVRLMINLYFHLTPQRTHPKKEVNAEPILTGSGTSTTTSPE
ncbi:MAG: hypothetical protein AAB305_06410 [Candidatus Zixiibacteriota bacterium]